MNREALIDAVETILTEKFANAHMDAFSVEARLNEDLCLDSVLLLELMLALELEHGLELPEDNLRTHDLLTIADLVALYHDAPTDLAPRLAIDEADAGLGVHGDDYVDVKVHCFVSSVCHPVKQQGLDQRPFYFGVADAGFEVGRDWVLRYHTPQINHDFFRDWYARLYGPKVRKWYEPAASKEQNLATMLGLLDAKKPSERLMVMLDLFHLPERENKFNQNPFPHYLMIEKTDDPAIWQIDDPDFRWEGLIDRDKIINAVMQPSVAGGFIFDSADIHVPRDEDLSAYFLACFKGATNPLTAATRQIVEAHLERRDGLLLGNLAAALRELPVLSIRKYGLEHGFAFFWRALKLANEDFETVCDEIERLIHGFKTLHYAILKLAETGDDEQAAGVLARLDRLGEQERGLKLQLFSTYQIWCEAKGLDIAQPGALLGEAA